jgi:hypothetical protein
LAIVTLILWVITAAAGLSLLSAGGAARRIAAQAAQPASVPVRTGAIPLTEGGMPPPVPRAKFDAPTGDHPLLEFTHPALALTGLACWFMFVLVHYRPMAWISFAVLVATLALGLTWLLRNRQATKRHASAAWTFPPRLVLAHGLAATLSIALTVLTALTASHG